MLSTQAGTPPDHLKDFDHQPHMGLHEAGLVFPWRGRGRRSLGILRASLPLWSPNALIASSVYSNWEERLRLGRKYSTQSLPQWQEDPRAPRGGNTCRGPGKPGETETACLHKIYVLSRLLCWICGLLLKNSSSVFKLQILIFRGGWISGKTLGLCKEVTENKLYC